MLLQNLTWPQVQQLDRRIPVLIPVAALEQHGHHLPLFTDSMLMGEVVRRVEVERGSQILTAPLMWLGNSDHHLDFPGTLSAAPRVYLDLLTSLIDNFIFHGFQRIMMINGHGGNDVPGKQVVFEVRQKYRQRSDLLLLFATYWSLGTEDSDSLADYVQQDMGHACEWETSMILRIAPELVGDYRNAETVQPGNAFKPASRGWITKDRTVPGHIGEPKFASAEKGERLFQRFSGDVVRMIDRVIAWDGAAWEG